MMSIKISHVTKSKIEHGCRRYHTRGMAYDSTDSIALNLSMQNSVCVKIQRMQNKILNTKSSQMSRYLVIFLVALTTSAWLLLTLHTQNNKVKPAEYSSTLISPKITLQLRDSHVNPRSTAFIAAFILCLVCQWTGKWGSIGNKTFQDSNRINLRGIL